MLADAIIAYVLGVAAGRAGWTAPDLFAGRALAWLAAVFGALGLVAPEKPRRALAAACGLVWGMAHAGLISLPSPLIGRVVAVNAPDLQRGTVLVAAAGHVYEALGPDRQGQNVRLRRAKFPTVLATPLRAVAAGPPEAADAPLVAAAGRALAERWQRAAAAQAPPVAALLRSIAIGDGSRLAPEVVDDFKATGIYHLLVVSGQHVTMIGLFAAGLLALPFRLGYALRALSPRAWRHADSGLALAAAAMAVLYAFATGLNAATQRAVVMFVAWQLARVFCGELPPLRRLTFCLAAQIVLFPIGLVSEASLMSWSAYLLCASAPKGGLRALVWLQMRLCVVAAAAFGQLALAGIAVNLLLVPVFTVAMLAAAVLVAAPDADPGGALGGFLLAFRQLVGVFAGVSRRYGYFDLAAGPAGAAVRAGLFLASGWIVLNTLRHLSISRYTDE